jgi:DNA-binding response OmpR family regulator
VVSIPPGHGERTRILFVPDQVLVSALDPSFLQGRSIAIRGVETVADALGIVSSWRPHLVVFRNQLEADAAAHFCRALAADANAQGTKLLMVTEALQDVDFAELADAGADAHLISPVEPPQLLATISELLLLEQRRANRAPVHTRVHTEGFEHDADTLETSTSIAFDLGEDGMVVEATRHLGLGAPGRVSFSVPGSAERLILHARVRAAIDEVRLRYAIEFLELGTAQRALIRRYVESRRKAA